VSVSPFGLREEETGRVSIRLRVGDPELRESLRDFLELRECRTEHLGEGILEAELPHELNREAANLELHLYVRVWQSLHGGVWVEVVD
jgi:hypothetical protein